MADKTAGNPTGSTDSVDRTATRSGTEPSDTSAAEPSDTSGTEPSDTGSADPRDTLDAQRAHGGSMAPGLVDATGHQIAEPPAEEVADVTDPPVAPAGGA